jgi:hypothetical protein
METFQDKKNLTVSDICFYSNTPIDSFRTSRLKAILIITIANCISHCIERI